MHSLLHETSSIFQIRRTRRNVSGGTRVHQWEGESESEVYNISIKPTLKVTFDQLGYVNLIIRLVWRIINQLGEDVTEEVVEETNQEDSWTPDGQVWW